VDWQAKLDAARSSHAERVSGGGEFQRDDLRLAGVASASWAEGLALLMLGRDEDASSVFARAAEEYATSERDAPTGSWGRPLAALRCRLLGGDMAGAEADARRTLAAGATASESPIALYAGVLAHLTLGDDDEAARLAEGLRGRDDFPAAVADALSGLARGDDGDYTTAVADVLHSFEQRDAFLEDVPVADTVLVLEQLARPRRLAARLRSPLLPAPAGA
jgi:hypothetical protein